MIVDAVSPQGESDEGLFFNGSYHEREIKEGFQKLGGINAQLHILKFNIQALIEGLSKMVWFDDDALQTQF